MLQPHVCLTSYSRPPYIVMNLFLRVGNKNNSCIRETQENSIEFQVQSSLPYILIPIVRANYCAPYPK